MVRRLRAPHVLSLRRQTADGLPPGCTRSQILHGLKKAHGFLPSLRLTRPLDRPLKFLTQGLRTSSGHGFTSQWLIPGAAGIALGVYALTVFSLFPRWAFLFILLVCFLCIAMIVGNVRRLLLAIILLELPLQVDIYLNYHADVAKLSAIGGLNVSVTTLSLVTLYALWFAERLFGPPHRVSGWLQAIRPPATYLAIVALSTVVARDVELTIFELVILVQMFLLYVYVVNTVRQRHDVLFIVTMLLLGLILESFVMMGLRLVGHSISLGPVMARIDATARVGGTIGSPNAAAAYLTLLLAPALSLLLTRLGRGYKALAILAFGLGGGALILTFSRGGWVAFAVSVTILCLCAWRRGRLSLTVPVVIAGVVLLPFVLFQESIAARLFGDDHGSAYSRVPLIQLAFRMILDHPLLGVGANNFALMIEPYTTWDLRGEWLHTVHNKYLLVCAETGIAGLIAFMGVLLSALRRGWRVWKLDEPLLSPLALGLTVAIAGQMVHMMVDLFNDRQDVLWLMAGLITTMDSRLSRADDI